MTVNPVCQVCRREAGFKLVKSASGKRRLWKCKSCLERISVSFLAVKERKIYK